MRPTFTHLIYEIKAGVRDKSLLLMNYLFPLVFFFIISSIMGKLNPSFKDNTIYSMSIFAMLSSLLLSMPGTGVAQREAGVFRSFKINGVPPLSLLGIPVVALLIHLALITLIIGTIAIKFFGTAMPDSIPRFILAWVCSSMAIAALGSVIMVISPSNRASILLSQLIFLPSMLLGSLMMPIEALSGSLKTIAICLPTSQAMLLFTGKAGWEASAVILGAGALLGFTVAASLFEWDAKNPRPLRQKAFAIIAILPYAAAAFV